MLIRDQTVFWENLISFFEIVENTFAPKKIIKNTPDIHFQQVYDLSVVVTHTWSAGVDKVIKSSYIGL